MVLHAPTQGLWTCLLQKNVLVLMQLITPSLSMVTLTMRACYGILSTIRDASCMIMERCGSIPMPPEEGDPIAPTFAGKVILDF